MNTQTWWSQKVVWMVLWLRFWLESRSRCFWKEEPTKGGKNVAVPEETTGGIMKLCLQCSKSQSEHQNMHIYSLVSKISCVCNHFDHTVQISKTIKTHFFWWSQQNPFDSVGPDDANMAALLQDANVFILGL